MAFLKFTKHQILEYLVFLGCLIALYLRSHFLLDSDFGWHFEMGKAIALEGVPKHDLFSYTMPSFPHVDHEWLSDLLLFKLHGILGYPALAILYSFLAFFAVYFVINKKYFKNIYLYSSLFVLAISIVLPYMGVRHQVISWFLLAVLSKAVFNNKIWLRVKYSIPILFLLWANLHGGFIVGLFLVWVTVLAGVIQGNNKRDILIPFTATLITLINPYGIGLWREVLSSLADARLRLLIGEWMPSVWSLDIAMLLFTAFSIVVISRNWREIKIYKLLIFVVFFVQAILSRRNVPLWTIVSLPLVSSSLHNLVKNIPKNKISIRRFGISSKVLFLIITLIFLIQTIKQVNVAVKFAEQNYYPQEALLFLDDKYPDKRTFSVYNWGGYIIWKSDRKVFIDGRMPSWRWKADKPGESNNAMKDYVEIIRGESLYTDAFQKYQIEVVMLPVRQKSTKLGDYLNDLFKIETNFNLAEALLNDGWIEVYRDNVAVIYYR